MTPGPTDVCKTPAPPAPSPVPMPYPNMAMCTQASCSDKVKIDGKKTIVKGSKISMSSGDEPGVAGGIMSSKIKGEAEFKMGSSKVKAEGKEVCYVGVMVAMNGASANMPAGMQTAPSPGKVKVMP